MQLGIIGLGKMGSNMAQRLLQHEHQVVGYDLQPEPMEELVAEGGGSAATLEALVATLQPPRNLWMMAPAGEPTEQTVTSLALLLQEGDLIVDGANSYYRDTLRRAAMLAENGIGYVDAGVSGGIWGLENGYCLMVGGDRRFVERVEPLFLALSPAGGHQDVGPEVERPAVEPVDATPGYAHVGPVGAGHFVKMVHNGIEYGLMQAYAEGFELMKSKEAFGLDMAQIANLWMHGSVVRSWLLELTTRAFEAEGNDLEDLLGFVSDSGMGRWTVVESVDQAVPLPAITAALQTRFRSRQTDSFAAKLLAEMRNQFGGHVVKRVERVERVKP